MELKDQVTPLELAKRLSELGVRQEGYFSWESDPIHGFIIRPLSAEVIKSNNRLFERDAQVYSAFTVAELGQMLTAEKNQVGGCFYHNPSKMWSHNLAKNPALFKTEAESRADVLIKLLEANAISITQSTNQ